MVTIGLFGTCGGSQWRKAFMDAYRMHDIAYYNPQVENWDPSCAEDEARHLAEDEIILFPITGETYGFGSLSEVGFSVLQAIRLDDRRDFIVMIDAELDASLTDAAQRKESLRARALVKQHLKKLRLKNLYVVGTLTEMLGTSIALHQAATIRERFAHLNPHAT